MTFQNDFASTMATCEHVIPRVFGGPTEWWNLAAACLECNGLRGHIYALEFYRMRQELSVEEIRVRRRLLFEKEFAWYRWYARGKFFIVWEVLKRLFGYSPVIPAVTLKRLA